MKFDFDKVVDRHGTKCLKYDFAKERGRSDDMLPLWVADMDFQTAPGIQKSLSDAVAHGIYGYKLVPICFDFQEVHDYGRAVKRTH